MTPFRRRRPSDIDPKPESKCFAGVQHVKARPDQSDRAVRNMKRSNQYDRLDRKLDELLGAVDDEDYE